MGSQKWKIGKHKTTVVSDEYIENVNFPSHPSEDGDFRYYGGFLVCESIPNGKAAQLISAAPQLLKCLKEAIETARLEANNAPKEWIEAVAIAEGAKFN